MKPNPYLLGVDALAGRHGVLMYEAPVDDLEEVDAVVEHALAEIEGLPAPTLVAPEKKEPLLKSEIADVPDEAWTAFVREMKVADPAAVSETGEMGMFAMKPRRLADLGLMHAVRSAPSPNRKLAWVGEFVKPLTHKKFLASPKDQYDAFVKSMTKYAVALTKGEVALPEDGLPPDVTLSGALALLHRGGPRALVNFCDGERFPATEELFMRTNGLF